MSNSLIPIMTTQTATSDKHSVWDRYCPIIETSSGYRVFLNDKIETPDYYNELCNLLFDADASKTVEFVINNNGGMADSAFMIHHAIRTCKATTVARVSGTAASAATIIAMACNRLEAAPYTSFMIHNYSGGYGGKGHEMKAQQEFQDTCMSEAFRDIYRGFLTEEEMDFVIEGKDMWIGTAELESRWKQRARKSDKVNIIR